MTLHEVLQPFTLPLRLKEFRVGEEAAFKGIARQRVTCLVVIGCNVALRIPISFANSSLARVPC